MAKNKKGGDNQLDDFDVDDSLDIDPFSFDTPDVKNDRNPMMSVASGIKEGMIDTVVSGNTIRRLIKEGMPSGYGQALDLADKTAGSMRGLYNETVKEMKPVVKDLKRVTGRMLPAMQGVLPKTVSEKIKNWTEDKDSARAAMLDAEQQRESSITMQLGEIFKMESEEKLRSNAQAEAKDLIKEGMTQARHKDQLAQLDEMRISLSRLASYKTTIESAFQRKSLELGFRHYFLDKDMLEEQRAANLITKNSLEGILKNTGLPEFAKINATERLKEKFYNDFTNDLNDNVFGSRREMLQKVMKNVGKSVREKISGTINGVGQALSGADSLLDIQEMQQQMGVDGKQMTGTMLGGGIADNMITRGARSLKKNVFDKHEGANKLSNKLSYGIENLPQIFEQWSNDTGPSKVPFADFFKNVIKESTATEKSSLKLDNLSNVHDTDLFNKRTNRSITDVIPGFLSRIHQELRIIRTGDAAFKPLMFDFETGEIIDQAAMKSKIVDSLFNKNNKEYGDRYSKELMDKIDPDGTMTPEEKIEAARLLTKRNMAHGKTADPKELANMDSYTEMGGDAAIAEKLATVFEKFFKDDKLGEKKKVFARDYRRLGDFTDDKRSHIQDLVTTGNKGLLSQLGLLSQDGKSINLDALKDMQLNGIPASMISQLSGGGVDSNALSTNQFSPTSSSTEAPPLPMPPPMPPGYTPPGANISDDSISNLGNTLKEAINTGNNKPEINTVNETLLRIEDRINKGIPMGGPGVAGGMGAPGGEGVMNMTLGGLLSGGFSLAGKGLKGASKLAGKAFGQSTKLLGMGLRGAKGLFDFAKKKVTELGDIYVGAEVTPRLLKWKLEAGHYIDETTGQVITKMSDIKGNVIDSLDPGTIVLRAQETKNAFMKSSFMKKVLTLPASIAENAMKAGGKLMGALPGVYKFGIDMVKKGIGLLKRPVDVYVVGKTEPSLLAIVLKSGGYRSKNTGKPIGYHGDIDGPVVDLDGGVVLSLEDLQKGLVDFEGKPLKSITDKLIDFGLGLGKKILGNIKKVGSKLKDLAGKGWDKLKGAMPEGTPLIGGMGFSGGRTNTILKQIRDLINTRLPGDPVTFDDSADTEGSAIGNGVKSAAKNIKQKLDSAKNEIKQKGLKTAITDRYKSVKGKVDGLISKVKDSEETAEIRKRLLALKENVEKNGMTVYAKEEYARLEKLVNDSKAAQAAKDKASGLFQRGKNSLTSFKNDVQGKGLYATGKDRLGKAKDGLFGMWAKKDGIAISGMDKLTKTMDSLKDFVSGKKKVGGDTDGDGIRDGSFADLMRKRKARKNQDVLDGKKNVWSGKGLLETLGDAKDSIKDKITGAYDTYKDLKDTFGDGEGGGDTGGNNGGPDLDPGEQRQTKKQRKAARKLAKAEEAKRLANARKPRGLINRGVRAAGRGAWGATKMVGRGMKGAANIAGRGIGAVAKPAAGLIGKGLGGIAKIGMKGLGAAGAAYGAYSAYQNIKEGNYAAAAGDAALSGAGLLASGATMGGIMGGLGTAATAIGAILSAPVVLGALAVGAVGLGAYYLYKSYKKKRPDNIEKYRYAQYGFAPDDADHAGPVFGLETLLQPALKGSGDKLEIDNSKVDMKALMESFGIDAKDEKAIANFGRWFVGRFKPVFLTNASAANGINKDCTLSNLSKKLTALEIQKFLTLAEFKDGPYDFIKSPFDDLPELTMTSSKVAEQFKATKEIADTAAAKEATNPSGLAAKTAVVAGAAAVATTASLTKPLENSDGSIPRPIGTAGEDEAADWTAMAAALDGGADDAYVNGDGNLKLAGTAIEMSAQGSGNINALAAIRYKTYGLEKMEIGKIKNILTLEAFVNKDMKVNASKVAEWTGSLERAAKEMTAIFGITSPTGKDGISWCKWFMKRFLPVYLNYATALLKVSGKSDIESALITVKTSQLLDIAMGMQIAKFSYQGDDGLCWDVTDTPWPNFVLNVDKKVIDENISALKAKVKDSLAKEELLTKPSTGTTAAKAANIPPPKDATVASVMAKEGVNFTGEKKTGTPPTSGINTQYAQSPTNTGDGTMYGANEAGEVTSGTGGMFNSLPDAQGEGTWGSVKDLILGAAKMVGVDGNLMGVMAAIESSFRTSVKAKTSSATGLYQFIKSTWDTMLAKYGGKYGISPGTSPADPKANALMGGEFIKENLNALKKKVNRPLTDTDVYMAHFLGAAGAGKFLTADPNAIAADILPKAAAANAGIFYKNSIPLTVAQVYNNFTDKIKGHAKKLGVQSNSKPIVASKPSNTATSPTGFLDGVGGNGATATSSTNNGYVNLDGAGGKPEAKVTTASVGPAPVASSPKPTTGNTAFGNAGVVDPAKPAYSQQTAIPVANTAYEPTTSRSVSSEQPSRNTVSKDASVETLSSINSTLASTSLTQSDILTVLKNIEAALKKSMEPAKAELPGHKKVASTEMQTGPTIEVASNVSNTSSVRNRSSEAPKPGVSMAKQIFATG